MLFQILCEVWWFVAGALEVPAEPSPEQRQAAQACLALHERRELTFSELGLRALRALAGERVPQTAAECLEVWRARKRAEIDHAAALAELIGAAGGRDEFERALFGARKAVAEQLGNEGLLRDKYQLADVPMPKLASVVSLAIDAHGRDWMVEVLDGPYAGRILTDEVDEAATTFSDKFGVLIAMSEAFAAAEQDTALRVTADRHALTVRVPASEAGWEQTAQCVSPASSCEQTCPLFGRDLCTKRRSGIGWTNQSGRIVSRWERSLADLRHYRRYAEGNRRETPQLVA